MKRILLGRATMVTLMLAVGCVANVTPLPPRGAAPPRNLDEIRPDAPDASAVWSAGYWHWDGAKYAWVQGRWTHRAPSAYDR